MSFNQTSLAVSFITCKKGKYKKSVLIYLKESLRCEHYLKYKSLLMMVISFIHRDLWEIFHVRCQLDFTKTAHQKAFLLMPGLAKMVLQNHLKICQSRHILLQLKEQGCDVIPTWEASPHELLFICEH